MSIISTLRPVEPLPAPRTIADQVRQLQADARELAADHVAALIRALGEVARLSGEIADGGELYPVGVREQCRVLDQAVRTGRLTITAIAEREPSR